MERDLYYKLQSIENLMLNIDAKADWIMRKLKDLDEKINDKTEEEIKEYIDDTPPEEETAEAKIDKITNEFIFEEEVKKPIDVKNIYHRQSL